MDGDAPRNAGGRVRLLGPIEVAAGGTARPVPGLRRKALLAVLGLRTGEVVSSDQLVDIVWQDKAPATASNTLQRHISYLRSALGDRGAIVARGRGYVLDLPGEDTDVQSAERLIRQGQQAVDRGQGAAQLRSALALWRGDALAEVCDLTWLEEQARRLAQLRVGAVRVLIEARLMLGEHAQVVPELQHLADQHPYDEDTHRQLMLALHRTGRQADALATFRRLRRTLRDDLGIDPSPAMRELEAAILSHDPALEPPAAPITVAPAVAEPTPAQLPGAVPGFVGRESQLARLGGLLDGADAGRGRPAAVAISVVSGTAGVGKSALAVHWAHRVADRFPDGQLYVNLRGFDPSGPPADPSRVLHRFLQALGMPVRRIPVDLDDRAAAYRSILSGRRVLVVLDNARDAEQVRPLLPGTPGCYVIVTSRGPTTPLIVTEGAVPVPVDLMSTSDSRDLLAQRLGAGRVAGEPAAIADIIGRCGGLPLALAIVGARAASHPTRSLAHAAEELRGGGALDALRGGDASTDIRVVFHASYATLSRDAAAMFRVLGVHPGPDISLAAAAAGAAVPTHRAGLFMAELVRANLVTEQPGRRYALHDLLRAYALERAELDGSDLDRRAILGRFLDHYVRHAYDGAELIEPKRGNVTVPCRLLDDRSEITDLDDAVAWFAAEHQVLLAAVHQAATDGFPIHAWHLAWTLVPFLHFRGHWDDQVAIGLTALTAAHGVGDRSGQAHTHRALAAAHAQLGELDRAREHYEHALELFESVADHRSAARTHLGLCWLWERMGTPFNGLPHACRAVALYRTAGDRAGEATALNMLGWTHGHIGDYDPALRECGAALALARELDDAEAQAWTLDSLGYISWRRGDHQQAIDHYLEAVRLMEHMSDPHTQAEILINLGNAYESTEELEAARTTWRRALTIMETVQHPDADRVRGMLAATG